MKRLKTILTLTILSTISACNFQGAVDLHQHIQGFWKVRQFQQSGETNEMYAQINDSIILYWYQKINYIFPYGYRIEGKDQLVVWLENDSLSKPKIMGTLSRSDADHFTLVNEGQRLEYERVPFEKFEEETGKAWKMID
jgi:hypothetical protein